MNPRIQELEGLLDAILAAVQEVIESGEEIPDDFLNLVAEEISGLNQEIESLHSEQPPTQIDHAPIENAPSPGAQLMWILAGQNKDAFISYLNTYPDPELRQLVRNPDELERNIQFLAQMMPPGGEKPIADGIEHADLNSSNVFGFKYDPKSGRLLVKFQGNKGSGEGPIYQYDGVPPNVYKTFAAGAVPARTSGQNKWGRWWRGKSPSLGAAMYSLIKMGGYPYRKLS